MAVKSREQQAAISGSEKHKLSVEKGYAKYIADISEGSARNKKQGVGSESRRVFTFADGGKRVRQFLNVVDKA